MFLRMSLFRVLIMATSLTEDRLSELRETFSMFDKDMNGSISTEELSQVRLWFVHRKYLWTRCWKQWVKSQQRWMWRTWLVRPTQMGTGQLSSQSFLHSWKSEAVCLVVSTFESSLLQNLPINERGGAEGGVWSLRQGRQWSDHSFGAQTSNISW